MKPKAILRFPKRSKNSKSKSGLIQKEKDVKYPSTLERLTYCFLPKKDVPQSEIERDIPDRVFWIEGELGDMGFPVRDAETMARALDFGHEHHIGRKTRGLVISSEELVDADDETRKSVFESIRVSLPFLAVELGVSRWIAVAHDDKFHPHVHFIFTNWDEFSRRRLDVRPTHLEYLQSMEWTESLDTGRGSREGKDKTPTTQREKELRQYHTGMTPLQSKIATEKEAPIQALRQFLNDENVPKIKAPHDLADFLFSHPSLPGDWDTSKLKSKNGDSRKNPAIIIAGVGLKLKRFFEFLTRNPSLIKKKEVKQGQNAPDQPI
jgi:hypothetical protein